MSPKPSIDTHAADIEYIKKDIAEIKEKLDKKYVSHETFDLSIKSINDAVGWIVKIAIFVITPIYGAVIALLFKIFAQ
jgi:tetrahydromethanopterin S-methyltransferase subunit G